MAASDSLNKEEVSKAGIYPQQKPKNTSNHILNLVLALLFFKRFSNTKLITNMEYFVYFVCKVDVPFLGLNNINFFHA